ncbi:hypothetical protein CBS115989_530 [Aspergillus niger]|nr:hypothetical protein CBS115989_530 [Aspergillus niger]KAI2830195.1 hypothetical protein CBS133816_3790 [Aspergillus niger]KAI2850882.1 hypothetical protein CBS11350_1474 [Aspergillus niger]KAI2860599.1 hypothetical protein CBS11232_1449 [Aspergillus niger]KAI2867561.1 hypothetical protein CBS12448_7 [Aspergillus niger]
MPQKAPEKHQSKRLGTYGLLLAWCLANNSCSARLAQILEIFVRATLSRTAGTIFCTLLHPRIPFLPV